MARDVKSERIRIGLGILTPEERKAREEKELERRQEAQRQAALGVPLLEVGDE
jgi:hypothetical protein